MVEKIKNISNPLTIIAIFASLSEIAGTVSIGFVNQEHQYIFIWFVMLFPTFLVVLFFLTLNFNPKVLYAPSDFREDDAFLKIHDKIFKSGKNEFEKVTLESKKKINHIPDKKFLLDIVRNFNRGVSAYLVEINNKTLTIGEHAERYRKIAFKKGDNQFGYYNLVSVGVVNGILFTLRDILFDVDFSGQRGIKIKLSDYLIDEIKKTLNELPPDVDVPTNNK